MMAASNDRLMRLATVLAVASALLLVSMKAAAYLLTNSVALLASLADSALDLLASTLNFFAVRQALLPADDNHRFGHGKAEPLSALGQAAFVAGSGVLLAVETASRLINPVEVERGDVGLLVMIPATIVTFALVSFQRYVVKKTNSLAIGADKLHYTGDFLINISVILAVYATTYLSWKWADPFFGGAIAAFLMFNAGKIAWSAISNLMDEEMPEDDRKKIIEIARQNTAVKNVHELRTRQSGGMAFIQMHIVLDKALTLMDAHRISDDVELALLAHYPKADIIIHQDPEGVPEVHHTVAQQAMGGDAKPAHL
ncbi:MAG: cation diffusion facilitator family transporter [Rhodospirillaceae bacterium]|nr:cation diffusion facilitator family transporter [Rhodospirillaceae bacterium]